MAGPKIRLRGFGGSTTPNDLIIKRFKSPNNHGPTNLAYDSHDRLGPYHPFIVEVVTKTATNLSFKGVSVETGEAVGETYSVVLSRLDHVWQDMPSTLADGGSADANRAILFLHGDYLRDKPELNALKVTPYEGCPKWPCKAGAPFMIRITELETLTTTLEAENASLKTRLAALQKAFMEVFTDMKAAP